MPRLATYMLQCNTAHDVECVAVTPDNKGILADLADEDESIAATPGDEDIATTPEDEGIAKTGVGKRRRIRNKRTP